MRFLIFFLLAGILLTGGPVYCFSPGEVIKLENHLTGCECPPTCQKAEEITLSTTGAKLPQPLPVVTSFLFFAEDSPGFLAWREINSFKGLFKEPNPLLFVKLLF